jgi:enamine deaminase RidA (YjgF/YER057c/UK114 family)
MTDIERRHTSARMSKIVRHDGIVYLCGQTAAGSPNAEAEIAGQVAETLARVDALLEEAGTDRSRLLSATIHLRDIEHFAAMNAVWEAWIPAGCAPARTTVEARLAAPELLFEVTVVAATP